MKLFQKINNYIYVLFKEENQNKVANKLHQINIEVFNIYQKDKNTIVKIKYDDYEKVKKYIKSIQCTDIKQTGYVNFLNIILKYKSIFISILIIVLCYIISSFFIVEIDINHDNPKIVNLIYSELDKNGISKFKLRKSFKEIQVIKENIKKNNLDQIDWLEIERNGMKYVVKVEQRLINTPTKQEPFCHVVSKKSAIIKNYKMIKGQINVDLNDYVIKGDTLINGEIKYNDEVKNKVCAEGKVYGEVWYNISISLPLTYYEKKYTDKVRNNFLIDINNKKIKLFKDRLKDYDEEKKQVLNILGINLYLIKQKEYKKSFKTYTEQEAIDKAIELAKEKVKLKLKNDDKIISEKILQKDINDSKMNIEIFIVTEEDIGEMKVIKESVENDS